MAADQDVPVAFVGVKLDDISPLFATLGALRWRLAEKGAPGR